MARPGFREEVTEEGGDDGETGAGDSDTDLGASLIVSGEKSWVLVADIRPEQQAVDMKSHVWVRRVFYADR